MENKMVVPARAGVIPHLPDHVEPDMGCSRASGGDPGKRHPVLGDNLLFPRERGLFPRERG